MPDKQSTADERRSTPMALWFFSSRGKPLVRPIEERLWRPNRDFPSWIDILHADCHHQIRVERQVVVHLENVEAITDRQAVENDPVSVEVQADPRLVGGVFLGDYSACCL